MNWSSWGWTSPQPILDLLFDASSQALLEVAPRPDHLGAEIGFLSILHTWIRTCWFTTTSTPPSRMEMDKDNYFQDRGGKLL